MQQARKAIEAYFQKAIEAQASDIYLIAGNVPIVRVFGQLNDLDSKVLEHEALLNMLNEAVPESYMKTLESEWDVDFAYSFDEYRLRVNLHYQQRRIALAGRIVPNTIPTPEALGFSQVLHDLAALHQGLILVTGPSGSGKSTTLAAMIEIINQNERRHIITLEDPIEFVYKNQKSIIEQREVGEDTKTFYSGLKYALRQDPDVILVGEMRDKETMAAALTAAETGHLVLSTLHTNSAAETVARIVDIFEPEKREQILSQLAAVLKGVISQELHTRKDQNGLAAVREIMLDNHAIASLIRQNKIEQIPTVIQTSKKDGMMTKDMAIKELQQQGLL